MKIVPCRPMTLSLLVMAVMLICVSSVLRATCVCVCVVVVEITTRPCRCHRHPCRCRRHPRRRHPCRRRRRHSCRCGRFLSCVCACGNTGTPILLCYSSRRPAKFVLPPPFLNAIFRQYYYDSQHYLLTAHQMPTSMPCHAVSCRVL